MASHIEGLMRQSSKFTIYKQDPESAALLETILHDFRPCFDAPLEPRDIDALREKIKNKISRTRAELLGSGVLKKTPTGCVLVGGHDHAGRSPAPNAVDRLQLEQWVRTHSPTLSWSDADFAINVFLLQIGYFEQRTHGERSRSNPIQSST